jgi:hypothetical protein
MMPKTTIHSRYHGQTVKDVNTGAEVRTETTHLHVGWTKGREHVEVAVLNPDAPSLDGRTGDAAEGWFMQLDREGCNRAIRAIRKARDDAFGVDA